MFEVIILTASLGSLPAPKFIDLPEPKFSAQLSVPSPGQPVEPVKPVTRVGDPNSPRRVARLPGPQGWFKCPQCGSGSDLMYLGQHLRSTHSKSIKEIEEIDRRDLRAWHDNMHNENYKPGERVVTQPTVCEDGRCAVGPIRRVFSFFK